MNYGLTAQQIFAECLDKMLEAELNRRYSLSSIRKQAFVSFCVDFAKAMLDVEVKAERIHQEIENNISENQRRDLSAQNDEFGKRLEDLLAKVSQAKNPHRRVPGACFAHCMHICST